MNQRGTVLVETLIALGAAVVIIAAITVMVISSLNNAQSAKSQGSATQYAQEGLEITRDLSRSNWASFRALSGINCLAEGSTELTPEGVDGCGQNVGNYVRTVEIQHDDTSCSGGSKVISDVSWSDTDCKDRSNIFCHSVELQSCLSNFQAFPSP
ncbi:hypothetical protein M1349_02540 [Patescibacteria group bacterium]|nr:hypothetical protein [Patescibacteria group bacterium]